jgi:hypothetical protein
VRGRPWLACKIIKPISPAELLLFGLIRACAPTNPRAAISTNMDPALPALSHSWKTNYAAVMAPPVAVQQKANASRDKRQFDRAFMTSLSFENDQATAVFSCRGVDL